MKRFSACAVGVALIVCGGSANAACVATRRADVPLRISPSGWFAPLVVNRSALPFLLDTGAERSMMFENAATAIGVRRDEWVATSTRGIGGDVRLRNADPETLTLGGLALRRRTLAADNTLVVAPAQTSQAAGGASGLLGQDLLSSFDIEIDAARAALTLFSVRGCGPRDLPWSGDAAAIPADRVTGDVLLIPVEIDGRMLRAEIDSGSSASLVTTGGIVKLGLTAEGLAGDPAGMGVGVGPRGLPLRRRRFAQVSIGGGPPSGMEFWVGHANILRSIDLLLGRDWVVQHRVWLSFSTNTVFVADADRP